MKSSSQTLQMTIALAAVFFVSAAAQAQPIHRSLVSTIGDDLSTFCTITDPCRTFQRAMKLPQGQLGDEVIALTGGD